MARSSTINVRILGDNKGLNKALSDSESRVGSWAGKIGKIGLAAGAAVVAGTVAGGVGLFKLGSNFDKELDKIRTGTGATGEQLAGLSDSFDNVLKGNKRANFDTAGTAIADLNTRLGLTGGALESLSGQFINLSDITGTDVAGNIDKITRVYGDWNIATGKQSEALDQIYRASQASGIGLDDLSGSVVQFGAPLRNLGFGFEDSLALLAQFNKTGVNTETVFAGIKAGVGKLAKDGEQVPETFRRIVDDITKLGPGSEATALAIELFGQRAGPDLADAIAGGKFAIDDMLAAITDGEDTVNGAAKDTESFGEKWNGIKNRVLVGLRPLAEQVFDGVGRAMDKLGPTIDRLTEWLSVNLPLAAAVVQAWFERNWPTIRRVMASVFDWLVNSAWPVVQRVLSALLIAAGAVVSWFQTNWPQIRSIAEQVLTAITTAASAVVTWFQTNWPQIRATIVDAFRAVSESAGHVLDALRGVFDWFRGNTPAIAGAAAVIGTVLVAQLVAWTAATWAQVTALYAQAAAFIAANAPIIAAAAALGLLVAGVVYAYENFETFREVVDGVRGWMVDTLWPAIQTIAGGIVTAFSAVVDWTIENWPKIQAVIEAVIGAVQTVIKTTIEVIRVAWETWGDTLVEFISERWEQIKTLIQAAIDIVRGIINTVTSLIRGDWDGAWDGIKTALSGVWDAIKVIVQAAIDNVKLILQLGWDVIGTTVTDTWNGIKEFFSDTWDAITGFVSEGVTGIVGFVAALPGEIAGVAAGAFDSLWESFKDVINRIIGGWNGLEFKIPGFDPPGPGPKFGGFTLGVPNIPYLASGHVATSPMIAMIGEYAGARSNPEIVAPRSMMLDTVREALDESRASGAAMPESITLIIEGQPFKAMLAAHDRQSADRLRQGVRS